MENISPELVEDQDEIIESSEPVAQPSIRESLASALEESKAKIEKPETNTVEVKTDKSQKTGRERDESGKFSKEQKAKSVSADKNIVEKTTFAMPKSFNQGLAAEWSKLPGPIQEQLAKREDDYHKELTKHDEERVFGREVRQLANPYLPVIAAEGGDIKVAFQQFLNTAYKLRTSTPQIKGQLLLQLAQEFGADLRGASQTQSQTNPQLQGLQQQVESLKKVIENEQALKKQQEDSAIQSQISSFAADPKNIHFEAVKAHMASLLKSGLAKDLQDAYDQAVYANPHTRSTLLAAQTGVVNEQRVANQKAKAEAARRAGSSIKGSPGIAATKNGRIIQPDLRSELKAQFAAFREG